MTDNEALGQALRALEILALGDLPGRALALAAATALSAFDVGSDDSEVNRALLEAARHLRTLAAGGPLQLETADRARAAALARIVRMSLVDRD